MSCRVRLPLRALLEMTSMVVVKEGTARAIPISPGPAVVLIVKDNVHVLSRLGAARSE
jgi:hypothetical protein